MHEGLDDKRLWAELQECYKNKRKKVPRANKTLGHAGRLRGNGKRAKKRRRNAAGESAAQLISVSGEGGSEEGERDREEGSKDSGDDGSEDDDSEDGGEDGSDD